MSTELKEWYFPYSIKNNSKVGFHDSTSCVLSDDPRTLKE